MPGARATAHTNIALIKYWGKADVARNLPAVPSLSLTLDAMKTETEVYFDPTLSADEVHLDGRVAAGSARERVIRLLDEVRQRTAGTARATVITHNDFPTASGLASSASGFAALALATLRAAGLEPSLAEASALARAHSASAARSLYGGFAVLETGAEAARPLEAGDWPLRMQVAITTREAKAIGSTQAMELCRLTSPYYEGWVRESPRLFEQACKAIEHRDFSALGAAMERSTLLMHASMFAAAPPIIYLKPTTLHLMATVESLRKLGTEAYFTMDAGPHVKVLTELRNAGAVARALSEVPGVERVIDCGPGPAASVRPISGAPE